MYDERGLKALDFVLETARKYGLQVRGARLRQAVDRSGARTHGTASPGLSVGLGEGGPPRGAAGLLRRARPRSRPGRRFAAAAFAQVILSLIDNWKYYNGVDQYMDWSKTAPKRTMKPPFQDLSGDPNPGDYGTGPQVRRGAAAARRPRDWTRSGGAGGARGPGRGWSQSGWRGRGARTGWPARPSSARPRTANERSRRPLPPLLWLYLS